MQYFIFLFLWSILGSLWGKTEISENPVERPLKIGAFNVQKLGNSKFGNSKVMDIVKKVLVQYDLILVQEIVTTDENLMEVLVSDLNKMSPRGTRYLMAISERVGRGIAKEQYAFLYRSERLKFLDGLTFPDKKDDFMRPPYIAHFATPTLRDINSLVVIGVHTQPKSAANETSAMAGVYDYAAKKFRQKNAVMMGDMNAGCGNLRISDWNHIDLWTREEFTWLISHDIDTTISANCCPYDRIVVAGKEIADAIIWEKIHVFNFRDAYGLTVNESLEVSDHWPIGVELRGKVSKAVSQHITVRACVTAEDARTTNLPPEIQRQKSTMGFQIEKSDLLTTLYAIGTDDSALLESLDKLQRKFSSFISKEMFDTIFYKVRNGALEDQTAHDDLSKEPSHSVLVDFDEYESTVSIHFCTETSPN